MAFWYLSAVFLLSLNIARADTNLRCLVCQQVVSSIISAVESEDPRKKIQVGSFRIQPDGSQKQAEVKYAGSELHLHEILETVCDSLNDYAQAKHKETGELTLLNLSKDVEKLNVYELVPDPDLNRSLKHYCESFIEEYEDDILERLNQSSTSAVGSELHLCQTKAGYCKSASSDGAHQEL